MGSLLNLIWLITAFSLSNSHKASQISYIYKQIQLEKTSTRTICNRSLAFFHSLKMAPVVPTKASPKMPMQVMANIRYMSKIVMTIMMAMMMAVVLNSMVLVAMSR